MAKKKAAKKKKQREQTGQGTMPALIQCDIVTQAAGATGTPGGRSSDVLDDLTASQAACADADPLGSALHDCPH
jgi:hypothetical protein